VKHICIALSLFLAGCAEPVRLGERVRVAFDSEDVRRVLFAERDTQIRERQAQSKAEYKALALTEVFENRESVRRREFLNRLDAMPGFYLETKTDARLLDTVRDCRCGMKEERGVYQCGRQNRDYIGSVSWPSGVGVRRQNQTARRSSPWRYRPF
jgi:hypothetical protein